MFSLRAIATRGTTSQLQSFLTRSHFSTETGTVKWYRYQKAYGFIVADKDSADVFVHRSALVGSDSGDVSNPVLKPDERVSFTRVNDNGRISATDVRFEDGTIIPTYRNGGEQKAVASAKKRLGFIVFETLEQGGNDGEMLDKIKTAFRETKEKIARIEEHQSSESEE